MSTPQIITVALAILVIIVSIINIIYALGRIAEIKEMRRQLYEKNIQDTLRREALWRDKERNKNEI